MKKTKDYIFTRFSADTIGVAVAKCATHGAIKFRTLNVQVGEDAWSHDTIEEFFADYRRKASRGAALSAETGYEDTELYLRVDLSWTFINLTNVHGWGWQTSVAVRGPNRHAIEEIFEIFESALVQAQKLPPKESPPKRAKPTIFIGHGRAPAWRDLKDHLHEQHDFAVAAFETGARAGHTARDVLEDMLKKSSFALIVLTAEDEQADGNMRARQNVIHEAGLFQGRLGFSRAILLLEKGCEEFTNVQGIQQLRFANGNIKETFGDVLATLRREFPGSD